MTEAIYAEASDGYDELFARATRLFIPALLRAGQIAPGQKVLDVATGTGAAALAAADLVGRRARSRLATSRPACWRQRGAI